MSLITVDRPDIDVASGVTVGQLTTAVYSLFDGDRDGHVAFCAYLNGGQNFLNEFFQNPNYHGKRETHIIPNLISGAGHLLPEEFVLVDFGSGQDKIKLDATMTGLKGVFGDKLPIVKYIANDSNPRSAEIMAHHARKNYGLTVEALPFDCTKIETLDTDIPVVGINWNSFVWNIEGENTSAHANFIAASKLSQILKIIGNNGKLFITHHELPEKEISSCIDVYNHPRNLEALRSIAEFIDKRLPLDVRIKHTGELTTLFDSLRPKITFDKASGLLRMNLVALDSLQITCESTYSNLLEKDTLRSAVNAMKLGQRIFNRICSSAGGVVEHTYIDPAADEYPGRVIGQVVTPNL